MVVRRRPCPNVQAEMCLRASSDYHEALLVQYLMNEADRNRALAHSRRDPLGVSGTNVADCKHARQARFKQIRCARVRPASACQVLRRQSRSGLEKTLLVLRSASVEPLRVRI